MLWLTCIFVAWYIDNGGRQERVTGGNDSTATCSEEVAVKQSM